MAAHEGLGEAAVLPKRGAFCATRDRARRSVGEIFGVSRGPRQTGRITLADQFFILEVAKADRPSPRCTIGLRSRATNPAHGLVPPYLFEAAVRWGIGLG